MNKLDIINNVISETVIYQIFYMLRPRSLRHNVNGILVFKNEILEFGVQINDSSYSCFDDLCGIFIKMCKERHSFRTNKETIIKKFVSGSLPEYVTKNFDPSDYENCMRKTLSKSVIKFCEMCENNHEDLYLDKKVTVEELRNHESNFISIMKNNINHVGYNTINPNDETVSSYTFRALKKKYDKLKIEHEELETKYKRMYKKYKRLKRDEYI